MADRKPEDAVAIYEWVEQEEDGGQGGRERGSSVRNEVLMLMNRTTKKMGNLKHVIDFSHAKLKQPSHKVSVSSHPNSRET